jgi:hypothetical protein
VEELKNGNQLLTQFEKVLVSGKLTLGLVLKIMDYCFKNGNSIKLDYDDDTNVVFKTNDDIGIFKTIYTKQFTKLGAIQILGPFKKDDIAHGFTELLMYYFDNYWFPDHFIAEIGADQDGGRNIDKTSIGIKYLNNVYKLYKSKTSGKTFIIIKNKRTYLSIGDYGSAIVPLCKN